MTHQEQLQRDEQIRQLYLDTDTKVIDIAARFDMTKGNVCNIIRRLGLPPRSRKWTDEERQYILAHRKEVHRLAELYNVTPRCIRAQIYHAQEQQ